MNIRSILFAFPGLPAVCLLAACGADSGDGSGGVSTPLATAASSASSAASTMSASVPKEPKDLPVKNDMPIGSVDSQINIANSALLRLIVGGAEAVQARSDMQRSLQDMALWKQDTDAKLQKVSEELTNARQENQRHKERIASLEKENADLAQGKVLLQAVLGLVTAFFGGLLPYLLNRKLNKVLAENAALDQRLKLYDIAEREQRRERQSTVVRLNPILLQPDAHAASDEPKPST